MTTSWNNTKQIERYLTENLSPADKFVFEARLLLSPALQNEVHLQKKVLGLIKMYHRKKFKEKLEEVHRQIFHDPEKLSFQQKIYGLFK
jgi:hypothetical protein